MAKRRGGGNIMKPTKSILVQYVDIKKETDEVRWKIEKVEAEIAKIEKDGNVIDTVRGGSGGDQRYKIEGFPRPRYARKKAVLRERRAKLSDLEAELLETLNQVEEFIAGIEDSRMRRIINLRFVENLSWNQVADCIGGGNTEGSVKMAFARFMEKE